MKFDRDRACRKCGGSARFRYSYGSIDRTCNDCGFTWTEAPLDKGEETAFAKAVKKARGGDPPTERQGFA